MSPLVSCGLDAVNVANGSPRQQLDELNDERPGRERIKKRLSLLAAEREASRLWKESLEASTPERGQQSSEYENVLRIHDEETGIKAHEDVDSYSAGDHHTAPGDSAADTKRSQDGDSSENKKALEALRWAGALEKLHIDVDGNWDGSATAGPSGSTAAALLTEEKLKRQQAEARLEELLAEQEDTVAEVTLISR